MNEEGEDEEDRDQKEKDEGGSGSEEESCKSEELPSEDACTHCGLPNHPELVRTSHWSIKDLCTFIL